MSIRERLERRTGGVSPFPLLLLFALNLVDEFDQVLFGVAAPEIGETFDLSDTAVISIATIAAALVIMLIVPIGVLADRRNRVKMTGLAAMAWGSMTVMTGVAGFLTFLPLLILARFGAGLGRVMNEPVHASLLADYYPPSQHGAVYSFHRQANPIGLMMILIGGTLADVLGWELAFILLAVPTLLIVGLVTRLTEPPRGASLDMGLAAQEEERAEKIPFGEAFRRLSNIRTLKRFWWAAAFLGAGVIPITTFFAFFFDDVYNVESTGVWGRAGITALYGVGAIIGLQIGARFSQRAILAGELPKLARFGGITLFAVGGALLLMSLAPWIGLSIAFAFLVGITGAGFTSYYLPLVAAIAPPRLRSQAFGWFGFFFALGAILVAGTIGAIAEESGYRVGIGLLAVIVSLAGLIFASGEKSVRRDAEQAFNSLMAESKMREELAKQGDRALLTCQGVEVAYDQVQVLFGVDMEVRQGEIVALLGTNGAGKSTLLKAISGTQDPMGGAIFFNGRDVTHADGAQTARLGIVQVPGGRAVFPTLTVAEHMRAAGWLYRDDPEYLKRANAEVLEIFPRLAERIDQQAGNLSGGEQQMLALAMAFIAKPKLLMIDELSLGLAPTIVEQLLGIVRKIQQSGTAIILVEQSINVALTVAERAYFMEEGEVR
ncbi:MAG: ATP-binding protein, partial [Actinomycetota bacterium]